MNILYLDAYFRPEKTAFTHLEEDIIQGLIKKGHTVKLICPVPSRGVDKKTAKEYKKKKEEILFGGGLIVKRFACVKERRNPLTKALRYFWCNFREYSLAKKLKDIDCVFAVSSPPTQGYLGVKVAKKLSKKYKKKVPFVYSLHDIFPDSLVTTGLTKEGSLIWKIGRKIEKYTYENSDKIVVISNSMKKNILDKGVLEEKITVVSNWSDTDAVAPIEKKDNKLFDEFNINKEKFIVTYAGNFGKAQGANVVLETAELLKEQNDILFTIFGGGSEFSLAKEKAEKMDNVIINPLLPVERTAEVYSLGDVAIVTCKKGVGSSGMPSKTWNIMACNTPIVASFDTDSELAEIISKANAGICVEPEDANALAKGILDLKISNALNGGREYVLEHASREKCVAKYVEEMEKFF